MNPAQWYVYFRSADVDATLAKVVELGGAVVNPAEDTPYGRLATTLIGREMTEPAPNVKGWQVALEMVQAAQLKASAEIAATDQKVRDLDRQATEARLRSVRPRRRTGCSAPSRRAAGHRPIRASRRRHPNRRRHPPG